MNPMEQPINGLIQQLLATDGKVRGIAAWDLGEIGLFGSPSHICHAFFIPSSPVNNSPLQPVDKSVNDVSVALQKKCPLRVSAVTFCSF